MSTRGLAFSTSFLLFTCVSCTDVSQVHATPHLIEPQWWRCKCSSFFWTQSLQLFTTKFSGTSNVANTVLIPNLTKIPYPSYTVYNDRHHLSCQSYLIVVTHQTESSLPTAVNLRSFLRTLTSCLSQSNSNYGIPLSYSCISCAKCSSSSSPRAHTNHGH